MKGVLSAFLFCFSTGFALDWWEGANFYQVYPRSFKDSNGDGVGDLKGIQSKLQYLKDLGMDGIWLSPIYKSPQADYGYDISDFRDVHKEFGTLEDLNDLIADCQKHDLKLILDFVPNHSSDEHEWFIKSESREPGYEDFYVWDDGKIDPITNVLVPVNNWISYFLFSAWKWSNIRKQLYLHQFHYKQPDLNYRNPKVVQEMKDVLTYWMNKGVAGFRIDAVQAVFERKVNGAWPDEARSYIEGCPDNDRCYYIHNMTEDQDETFDMVYQWKELLNNYKISNGGDTKIMMIESYSTVDVNMRYYGAVTKEGAQIPFNFELVKEINAVKKLTAFKVQAIVEEWIYKTPTGQHPNWVVGNHDQHRIASKVGVAKIDLINILVQTLPGIAITYMGEEIGMEDVRLTYEETVDIWACNGPKETYHETSRDPARTPIPWDDTKNGGFTSGNKTWLPVGTAYTTVNVKAQQEASNSHLKIFKSLTSLRKHAVLREGTYSGKVFGNVYAYKREIYNSSAVILLNFGSTEETVNARSLFPSIPNHMIVYISSLDSGIDINAKIDTTKVTIKGSVGMVLLNAAASGASSHLAINTSLIIVTSFIYIKNMM